MNDEEIRECKDCGVTDEDYERSWVQDGELYQCFDCYEDEYEQYISDDYE